jgi:hypothetical protein
VLFFWGSGGPIAFFSHCVPIEQFEKKLNKNYANLQYGVPSAGQLFTVPAEFF